MGLLDGDLAADIGAALGDVALDVVVTRTPMVPGPNPWDPPTLGTPVNHACKGWDDSYDTDRIDGTVIQVDDRKVVILADSLAIEPALTDAVTVRGSTYTIVSIASDPAHATWTLQARA
jgi:hypothetical protein